MSEQTTEPSTGNGAPFGHHVFFGRAVTTRHFLTRRIAPAALVSLILVAGGPPLVASLRASGQEASPQRDQAAMPVTVEPAEAVSSYTARKPYTGALVAGRRSKIGFERPGKIIRLSVEEGQRVKAGQVLAELDRRRLTASRLKVEAELLEAQAVLAELVEGPRKETIAAAAAEVDSLAAQRRRGATQPQASQGAAGDSGHQPRGV